MLAALFSGISGIRSHQIFLNVVGNNIANINTPGFKQSRVKFADLMSQTLTSGAAGNLSQVGLGVRAAGVDRDFTQGTMIQTSNMFDLAIGGKGFFVINDGSEDFYTRAGAFSPDANGFLEDSITGYKVMGYKITNGVKANSTSNIEIPFNQIIPAKETSTMDMVGNLSAEAVTGDTHITTIDVFDKQGITHILTLTFTKVAAANTWDLAVTSADGVVTDGAVAGIVYNNDGSFNTTGEGTTGSITLDYGLGAQAIAIDFGTPSGFDGTTQVAGTSASAVDKQDGYESGNFSTVSTDTDGTFYAIYTNGQSNAFAQLERIAFNQPNGLEHIGSNLFRSNRRATGEPISVVSQSGRGGNIMSGTLENSNVDITRELTNLIIAQRGFQANSRTITTSSQVLQELMQIV
ncbi:MAG: flagellar hook protein FlgE [Candidatus Brocadiales bacterium]